MRQTLVRQIQPDVNGPTYGQVSDPANFTKSQDYAHEHVSHNARDFIVGECANPAVAGFNYSLPGALVFRVDGPGHVVGGPALEGKSYEMIGVAEDGSSLVLNGHNAVDLALAAADDTHPRIDLIVAKLEAANAIDKLIPFVRLRTQQELNDHVVPYPPEQFTQATEFHCRATVQVKTGTPGAQPAVPELATDEEPLYAVLIGANATTITASNVTDLRNLVASNCVLQDRIESLRKLFLSLPLKHRHHSDEIDLAPGSPAYQLLGVTDQDALDTVALRLSNPTPSGAAPALRPEILRPDVTPYDAASGKLGSSGSVIAGTPVCRIPYPRQVAFATGVFSMDPNSFVNQSLNPRLYNDDPNANDDTDNKTTNLSLAAVVVTETDGGGDWQSENVSLAQELTSALLGRKTAARDGRYLEIFGLGSGLGGSSWYTYDTLQKTLTPRNFSGAVPTFPIAFAAPCGDGKILLAVPFAHKWYRVDASDPAGTCVEVANGPAMPEQNAPWMLMGDLIQQNVIVIYKTDGITDPTWWVYHVDTNQFEQIAPIGQGPTAAQNVDLCMYKAGQALIYERVGNNGRTIVLDYSTLSFTVLNITPPTTPSGIVALNRFRLLNINGRPQLVSDQPRDTATTPTEYDAVGSFAFELTPGTIPQWTRLSVSLPARWDAAAASLLSSGLPTGIGYFIGGQVPNNAALRKDIWRFSPGGIVETNCGGVTGVTLGPGTRSATFRLADYALPWQVGRVLITFVGQNLVGRVKVSESFDNGAHLQDIPVNANTVILNSNVNPARQLFVTLIGTDNVKPCISQAHETFERFGAAGGLAMVYLVYDCPVGTTYLFMDDTGKITSEANAVQTTQHKAILHKATKNGGGNPTLFDYLNKPWYGKKYEPAAKSGGVDPTFANDLAVLPSYIECWKVAADGTVHLLADCTIVFNGNNTVTGLANGESCRVHLAG